MEMYLTRTTTGFSPCDDISKEEIAKFKLGTLVLCKLTRKQNSAFHRKMMALFNVGFEYWVPGEIDCKFGKPQKNFKQFRKDLTILAGHYDIVHRLDGTFRVEAKSIAFDSMEPDDREKLYSSLIDVLLEKIFVGYQDKDVLGLIEKKILEFC